MQRVCDIARKLDGKEIPVCAIIVKDGEVIGNWRLDGCELYVNLEPCPMCAWAIIQSRIDKVYFGSYDKNYGALGSAIDLRQLLNSGLKVYGGIMEEECNKILEDYFAGLRGKNA